MKIITKVEFPSQLISFQPMKVICGHLKQRMQLINDWYIDLFKLTLELFRDYDRELIGKIEKATAELFPKESTKLPPSVESAVTKSNANSENVPTSSVAASYIGKVLTSEERAFLLKDASRIPNINLVAMLIVFLPYLTYLLNEG